MIEYGFTVRYSTPDHVDRLVWQPVAPGHMPRWCDPVWAYVPEGGNEDEGFGGILLARYFDPANELFRRLEYGGWYDCYDDERMDESPVLWTPLWMPDEKFVTHATPEQSRAHWTKVVEQMLNRTGPFARNETGQRPES